MWILWAVLALALLAVLAYWLLVITEGVYLGRHFVVWMYDVTAHKYDGIKGYDAETEIIFVVRPFLSRLAHIPAPLILDVATGTGRVPWFTLQMPRFHGRFVALEPSQRMLALAVERLAGYGGRASTVQATAVPLPFPAHSFDAVSCLEALEFFPSDEAALREMARVLRPGGTLMVTRRRGWEAKTFFGRYRSADQFATLLHQLGFTDVQRRTWQMDYDLIFAQKEG